MNGINILHAHINEDQILKLINGRNLLTYTNQVRVISILSVTRRHIEILCCQKSIDGINGQNSI